MSEYKYFTTLTDIGKQKLAEAVSSGTVLDFGEMAVGDSGGEAYNPTTDMTALKNELYRSSVSSIKINENDKNVMEFEFVVPASSGGYYIREAGLFTSDGTLFALSGLPEQYKSEMAEGAGSSMTIRMLIAVSSEAQIYINVPESTNYATQTYVNEKVNDLETDLNLTISSFKNSVNISLSEKADINHNHDNYMPLTPSEVNLKVDSGSNNGGAINFYFNGKESETVKIHENEEGVLNIIAPNGVYINGVKLELSTYDEVIETEYGTWEIKGNVITGKLKGQLTGTHRKETSTPGVFEDIYSCSPEIISFPKSVTNASKISGELISSFSMNIESNGKIIFSYSGSSSSMNCSLEGVVVKATLSN